MRKLLALLALATILPSSPALSAPSADETARLVARLGTPASPFSDFDALDRNRCSALPLVVAALVRLPDVPPGKVGGPIGRPDDKLSNRASSLLRALRILTGHDEYGPISHHDYMGLPYFPEKPGGDGILNRDRLILGLPKGKSRFFAYWLSRGTSYYAPLATQRAIKSGWATYVRGFDCRKKLDNSRWDAGFFNG